MLRKLNRLIYIILADPANFVSSRNVTSLEFQQTKSFKNSVGHAVNGFVRMPFFSELTLNNEIQAIEVLSFPLRILYLYLRKAIPE